MIRIHARTRILLNWARRPGVGSAIGRRLPQRRCSRTIDAAHLFNKRLRACHHLLVEPPFARARLPIEGRGAKLVTAGVLNFGVIMGASNRLKNASAPVQVASIQTLIRRELPPADLIIIDECHLANARSYFSIIANCPNVVVLGLTATPERTDGNRECLPRHTAAWWRAQA